MSYTPNVSNKRNYAKVKTAYSFARACLSSTNAKPWSSVYIDKVVGRTNQPLGRWLREHLLTCVDETYSFNNPDAHCKEYILNKDGAQRVRTLLKGTPAQAESTIQETLSELPDTVVKHLQKLDTDDLWDFGAVREWVRREYGAELAAGDFTYKDKADRWWNPLQNIATKFRDPLFMEANYNYSYDIVACAPTLIYQDARRAGMTVPTPHLEAYLANRTAARAHISALASITPKLAKTLLNSFFCGAYLSTSPHHTLWHLLGQDARRVKLLKDDAFLTGLRQDIGACWKAIEPQIGYCYKKDRSGRMRKQVLRPKQKWARYFRLERQVMKVVRDYLSTGQEKFFLEHDGVRTQSRVEMNEVIAQIRAKTGFELALEEIDLETGEIGFSSSPHSLYSMPLRKSLSPVEIPCSNNYNIVTNTVTNKHQQSNTMAVIYALMNSTDNRCYIGSTMKPARRLVEHLGKVQRGNHLVAEDVAHVVFHVLEVIPPCPNHKRTLWAREKHWRETYIVLGKHAVCSN